MIKKLIVLLIILTGCANQLDYIDTQCVTDNYIKMSKDDTLITKDNIRIHNCKLLKKCNKSSYKGNIKNWCKGLK